MADEDTGTTQETIPVDELDVTPSTPPRPVPFEPPITSTPLPASTPLGASTPIAASTPAGSGQHDFSFATPRKNIRFMDESVSKIHVFPTLPSPPRRNKTTNFATVLPTIPDEPQPYSPILYTFRVPEKWPRELSYIRIRTPPFYLLLDHTIAVIWCMFNPNVKKNLGVAQLQWALSFLKTIYYNKDVDKPKDVGDCIDAISDYLIELYAEISCKLQPLKNMEKSQREAEEAPVETEIPFSLNYSQLFTKSENLSQGNLSGGPLVNIDSVYRKEVEELREIAQTDSVELITSKSREAAIDYLNETRSKHWKNLQKEFERVRSLDNLLGVISSDAENSKILTDTALLSLLRQDETDINNTVELDSTLPTQEVKDA